MHPLPLGAPSLSRLNPNPLQRRNAPPPTSPSLSPHARLAYPGRPVGIPLHFGEHQVSRLEIVWHCVFPPSRDPPRLIFPLALVRYRFLYAPVLRPVRDLFTDTPLSETAARIGRNFRQVSGLQDGRSTQFVSFSILGECHVIHSHNQLHRAVWNRRRCPDLWN